MGMTIIVIPIGELRTDFFAFKYLVGFPGNMLAF